MKDGESGDFEDKTSLSSGNILDYSSLQIISELWKPAHPNLETSSIFFFQNQDYDSARRLLTGSTGTLHIINI